MATYEVPDNEKEDDVVVDLNEQKKVAKNEADDQEIEVEDDTPEEDRGRRPRDPKAQSAVPSDDEIGKYTKGVQDRLRTMAWEYHEERRAKESALRENQQALDFAKRMLDQNKKLQEALEKGHKTFTETSKKSAENEITVIRSALSQAIGAGDTDKIAELNVQLGRATARAEAVEHIPRLEFPQQPEMPKPAQQEQQRPRVQLTDTNSRWMETNKWFGSDQRMTAVAMAIHEQLLKDGVTVESKTYYDGIDRGIRETFPDKFKDEGESRSRPRSVVAPTTRSPARNTGKVTLTLSQQRVAEKLGIPLKDYAREYLQRTQEKE
jgi:hypothetical protein